MNMNVLNSEQLCPMYISSILGAEETSFNNSYAIFWCFNILNVTDINMGMINQKSLLQGHLRS